jgi:hypothetical protein
LVESDISKPDALGGGQGADAAEVGEPAVDRREVELEVARVQDHALAGVHGDGVGPGHGVRHRDELDVERPDATALAVVDAHERGAVEEAGLVDPVGGQPEGEVGAVDGERAVAQEVRQAADVVLVAVGGHARLDAVGVLAQVREVGEDEVDAVHVGVGEHEPAVDEQQPARPARTPCSCGRSPPGRRGS